MKNKRIPTQKPLNIQIMCEKCAYKIRSALIPGENRIVCICPGCGSILKVSVNFDGYAGYQIIKGSIEVLCENGAPQ